MKLMFKCSLCMWFLTIRTLKRKFRKVLQILSTAEPYNSDDISTIQRWITWNYKWWLLSCVWVGGPPPAEASRGLLKMHALMTPPPQILILSLNGIRWAPAMCQALSVLRTLQWTKMTNPYSPGAYHLMGLLKYLQICIFAGFLRDS